MSASLVRVDVSAALAGHARVIEAAIDALLPLPEGPERRLIEAMRYATLGGGKRLRGFLVMEVAGLFGVKSVDNAVPLLVRMVGIRNALAGLRTLQAEDDDLRRLDGAGSGHVQREEPAEQPRRDDRAPVARDQRLRGQRVHRLGPGDPRDELHREGGDP